MERLGRPPSLFMPESKIFHLRFLRLALRDALRLALRDALRLALRDALRFLRDALRFLRAPPVEEELFGRGE